MNILKHRAIGLSLLAVFTAAMSACSSTAVAVNSDSNLDDKSYVTGSRLPRKGAQPVTPADQEFAREALRQQKLEQLGSVK
ncbi:hypothetical protein [Paucibacter sp. KCTC 42545]|uniref:hypothetical protein n=1 Tax=Paucibacter sp. KCTC 42545 TaxID=1768242 RepID=UPI0012E3E75A|nr:hypothetical protein [Paucibacter sp. KCTC 42545]